MMGFQFAAGRRQAAFNNFLMEAWRPSSAPAANVETLILTGVILEISYSPSRMEETAFPSSFCSAECASSRMLIFFLSFSFYKNCTAVT